MVASVLTAIGVMLIDQVHIDRLAAENNAWKTAVDPIFIARGENAVQLDRTPENLTEVINGKPMDWRARAAKKGQLKKLIFEDDLQ
jgi:hypothetical protein